MFLKSVKIIFSINRRNLFLISPIFLFVTCSGNGDSMSDEFYSDTIIISGAYPKLSDEIVPIIEQLEMCTTSDTVLSLPPCTNEFFRIFNYRPTKKLTDGFIVEMIPGLFGAPVHQIVIIENYMGKYQSDFKNLFRYIVCCADGRPKHRRGKDIYKQNQCRSSAADKRE